MKMDASLARRLIASQFPQWKGLPVSEVAQSGWDNRTFHLGDEMAVRLPSSEAYSSQATKEHRWLPVLAPHLPLAIPQPLALGQPDENYPWLWSVRRWIEGESARPERIADLNQFAKALGAFLAALQGIDATGGPAPGPQNFYRGGPLSMYGAETHRAIDALKGEIDAQAATAIWGQALAASWTGAPVWLHGDVSADNLLVKHGRLCAVIDFGQLAVGDPACDLTIAWTLFSGPSRSDFRHALPLDENTWARSRGWTLWKALITMERGVGAKAEAARSTLGELIADYKRRL